MTSLLSLPRELRDTIIDFVVKSPPREPPLAQPGGQDSNGSERIQHEDTYWKEVGNLIYFERAASCFQPAFGGLLLACRQLRAETLERASKVDIPYILDLLVVNEEKIWVTWLSMPASPTRMIEDLRVNVRMQCDDVGFDFVSDPSGFPRTQAFTLVFGTQMRNLLYRILAVGCAGALPDHGRRSVWTGARYKFHNTIRFEHEYIPHYTIRNLSYHFADLIHTNRPSNLTFQPLFVRMYVQEWKEVVDELAGHNVLFGGSKHPGWKTVRERIGGIRILQGKKLYCGNWADLSTQYTLVGPEYPNVRGSIEEVLEVRRGNGL